MKIPVLSDNQKRIINVYILVLLIFTSYRFILFFTELSRVNFQETSMLTVFRAFLMGVRFDAVISSYLLILPCFIVCVKDFFTQKSNFIEKILFYLIFVLFSLAFAISAADIPYFNQFYDRFSIGAFEWMDNGDFVFSMIVQEPKYILFIIPYILFNIIFFIRLKKIWSPRKNVLPVRIIPHLFISLLFLLIIFVGIRGRVQKKSPIRIGTAYFSDQPFLNKMGLNPVFTFMRTYLDSKDPENQVVQFMDSDKAKENVINYLGIDNNKFRSPVAREISCDTCVKKKLNIVVVIMESMSAAKMSRHGNPDQLTPFLDSLSNESIYFENVYSSGKHTFNGIFSTLFSFPALYRQHTMKSIRSYNGIGPSLKKHGYSTTFFITHDSQFDNVEGFLRANEFDNVISQKDYPMNEVKTTLGVPDDYMFRYSIPVLNDLAKENKPFFVSFMTASDHGPYYIPDYFTPKTSEIKKQIVEYADWSIQSFMEKAKSQSWFDNTLFVFVADHGVPIDADYDLSLDYFHVPLIFYAPQIFKSKTYTKIGSQIDIFPTIMGLLGINYINNTLGIDLLSETRDYAIVNDDDKIGILDSTHLCIMKEYGKKLELFHYRTRDRKNYIETSPSKAEEMAEYAKSNMQVYQDMILDGSVYIKE